MSLATFLAAQLAADVASPLGDAPTLTIESALGANLVDIWYPADAALSGSDVTSLVGQRYGLSLTPSGVAYPTYNASDANFAGKPSISCYQTGNKYLRNNALPTDFAPAGNRPFAWVIGRWRDTQTFPVVADQCALSLRESGGNWDSTIRVLYANDFALRVYFGTNLYSQTGTYDTDAHVLGGHLDVVNGSSLFFDGSLVGTNASGTVALPDALDVIWIGANGVGSEAANFDFAVAGVCLNAPTAQELAAFYQAAARDYGL